MRTFNRVCSFSLGFALLMALTQPVQAQTYLAEIYNADAPPVPYVLSWAPSFPYFEMEQDVFVAHEGTRFPRFEFQGVDHGVKGRQLWQPAELTCRIDAIDYKIHELDAPYAVVFLPYDRGPGAFTPMTRFRLQTSVIKDAVILLRDGDEVVQARCHTNFRHVNVRAFTLNYSEEETERFGQQTTRQRAQIWRRVYALGNDEQLMNTVRQWLFTHFSQQVIHFEEPLIRRISNDNQWQVTDVTGRFTYRVSGGPMRLERCECATAGGVLALAFEPPCTRGPRSFMDVSASLTEAHRVIHSENLTTQDGCWRTGATPSSISFRVGNDEGILIFHTSVGRKYGYFTGEN